MAGANLSDDVSELSRAVAQLTRIVLGVLGGSRLRVMAQFEALAPAAGLSVAEAREFWSAMVTLPPHQGLRLSAVLLEAERARQASYQTVLRQGHAGSDIMGGPAEYTAGAVEASAKLLAKDFPAWRIGLPDGFESLGGERPKLTWMASHPEWADVYGATAAELRGKLELVEASFQAEAKKLADYNSGRGVRGRARR